MGQLTKEFVAGIIRDVKLKKRPNLTLWELEQLALAWLKLREPKPERPSHNGDEVLPK